MAHYCSNTLTVKGLDAFFFLSPQFQTPIHSSDLHIRQTDDCVVVLFETRWEPNVEWFEHLCKQFPALYMELIHVEENEGIAGKMWNENGLMKDIMAFKDPDSKSYFEIIRA